MSGRSRMRWDFGNSDMSIPDKGELIGLDCTGKREKGEGGAEN